MKITIWHDKRKEATMDCVTVAIEDGKMRYWFGMDEHASGFNQFVGDEPITEHRYRGIGTRVNYYDCNIELQKAIAQRLPGGE